MYRSIVEALFPPLAAPANARSVALGGFGFGATEQSLAVFDYGPGSVEPRAVVGVYRSIIKRALDVVLVLLSAPVVVPIVLILAVLVARGGGRPFYSQLRLGKQGRAFRMWKLRSMVVDADGRLAAHLDADPEARAEWDRDQKLQRDPRITRFGHFLRKSSLDELPQLWNVFWGDMSIVGPRPMMLSQQAMYPGASYRLVRPGLTGLWQTTDRNESTFAARAEFDTLYVATMSLMSDLHIILKTVQVVAKGTGR